VFLCVQAVDGPIRTQLRHRENGILWEHPLDLPPEDLVKIVKRTPPPVQVLQLTPGDIEAAIVEIEEDYEDEKRPGRDEAGDEKKARASLERTQVPTLERTMSR
jgi:hypothetical protein